MAEGGSNRIPRRAPGVAAPLSAAQQRFWFFEQIAPGTRVYNRPTALRLRGPLAPGLLEASLNDVLRRHEVLRTTFALRDGEPMQLVPESARLTLEIVDLRDVDPAVREARAAEVALEGIRQPIDLATGPLVRGRLIRLGAAEHVLVLTIHHIAFDGWSEAVLLRELGACLEARAAGREPALEPLSIQYGDYAAWQQARLQGGGLEPQLEYWRGRLRGVRGVLDLPTDRPRPRRREFRGARIRQHLPDTLVEPVKRLGRSRRATPFMSLLAAWSVLLQRWTATDDLVIGCPVAGRTRVQLEDLIGCFINLFPVRLDLTGDPPFVDLLDRVREAALGAYANQDAPFQVLLAEARPERDPARAPLFQVSFNLRNLPEPSLHVPGLEASVFELETGTAMMDLFLELTPHADGIEAALEYDADLFDEDTAGRMLRQYRTLLEAIVRDPAQILSELPILSDAERQAMLRLGRGETVPPPPATVSELIARQAEKSPDVPAVTLEEGELTYRDLDRAANRLAHRLRALGVSRSDLVGICLERSLDFAVTLLASLRAGAAWCPLDPSLPQARLGLLVEDARPRIVVTVSGLLAHLPAGAATLCLDTERPVIDAVPAHDPGIEVEADDVAYVIYTSGSTGTPKGSLITHANFRNTVLALAREFEMRPGDRVVQFSAIGFDAVVAQTFSPWVSGATVVLRTDAWLASDAALLAAIQRERISALFLTSALWNRWVGGIAAAGKRLPDCVRLGIAGGDRAAPDAFRNWLQIGGDRVRWLNAYGPTETTVAATTWDSRTLPPDVRDLTDIPIGRPLANTAVYVLDASGAPVPVGVPGELCIGGAGVGLGYLNRPDLTAERFVPDPFADDAAARMYRTGDRARFLPDGNLQFLGRLDRQVKLRGYRVEPGEIETVLRRHPGVATAVITVRDEGTARARLIAFFVAADGDAPDGAALRRHLREALPGYMIPAAFVRLDDLPVGPTGKPDLQALDELEVAHAETPRDGRVAPRNTAETRMAAIWEEMLGVLDVGVTDDFFELGGHSLLALQLGQRIEEEFGATVPISVLFERATIEHLVQRIAAPPPTGSPLVPVQPEGAKRPFFCVHEFFGDVFLYERLARRLGCDQPFYGLQASGVDGTLEPKRDVKAMAATYIRALRSVQPEGPYAVGGLCAGGLVALEMAQQLRDAGEDVALLALLDSNAWTFADSPERPPLLRRSLDFVRDLPHWLRGLGGLTPAQRRDVLRLKAGLLRERFRPSAAPPEPGHAAFGDLRIHALAETFRLSRHHRRVARAFREALSEYRPQPYEGRIVLFRALMQPLFGSHDRAKGWRLLAKGPFEIRFVPGNHLGMLQEPHVASLARELAAALAEDASR
ncbi:MAG: amino acid adenylation domain-containing protein [Gemmatimonadota bacterium]|jgi:amino acid adenylation domain-containing protein